MFPNDLFWGLMQVHLHIIPKVTSPVSSNRQRVSRLRAAQRHVWDRSGNNEESQQRNEQAELPHRSCTWLFVFPTEEAS